jgi:prepilin-type N-terminal cleavage/methylation domain-containing protein
MKIQWHLHSSHNKLGFSLLELLVSMFLLGLCSLLVFPYLLSTLKLQRKVLLHEETARRLEYSVEQIKASFELSRSFDAVPTVFFTDLALNTTPDDILKTVSALRRDSEQGIISTLQLDTAHPLAILTLEEESRDSIALDLCSTETWKLPRRSDGQASYWIGLSLTSAYILKGELSRATTSRKGCKAVFSGELTVAGLLAGDSASKPSLKPIFKIFPVEDLVSFFVDDDAVLRYFSHVTGENQPLAKGIKSFNFTPQRFGLTDQLVELSLSTQSFIAAEKITIEESILFPVPSRKNSIISDIVL